MAPSTEPSSTHPGRAKGTSLPGNILFLTLRTLDVPLQLWFLSHTLPQTTSVFNTGSNLSPYYALILGMTIITSLRHAYWKLAMAEQLMPPAFAVMVSIFNSTMNGLNVLMSLWRFTSQAPASDPNQLNQLESYAAVLTSPVRVLGLALFVLGSVAETYSEIQRGRFKSLPHNKGKLFTSGLFGQARHMNYGSYLLWRVGFAVFCGGWAWGAVVLAYFLWYFTGVGVPGIEAYMEEQVSFKCFISRW